jgi:fatty-acid desaturase
MGDFGQLLQVQVTRNILVNVLAYALHAPRIFGSVGIPCSAHAQVILLALAAVALQGPGFEWTETHEHRRFGATEMRNHGATCAPSI